MYKTLFGLIFVGALAAGCGSKATGSTCPTTNPPTYANFGQNFMQTYCLSCHGASGRPPNLSTLANIQAERTEIDETAAAGPNGVNTEMPENGSVPEAERRRLGEWLACGAPQ